MWQGVLGTAFETIYRASSWEHQGNALSPEYGNNINRNLMPGLCKYRFADSETE
jgi:hypothetical protein